MATAEERAHTQVPLPDRLSSQPASRSASYAATTVVRLSISACASSRSDGRRLPGMRNPLRTASVSARTSFWRSEPWPSDHDPR
jgi:hypothetical protein